MDRETYEAGLAEPTPATRIGYFTGYFAVHVIAAVLQGAGWAFGFVATVLVVARALRALGVIH